MTQFILALEGAENVRDLGGYHFRNGQKVRSKKLVRSAGLHNLSAKDHAYLRAYGVQTIVDFRTKDERDAQPDSLPNDMKYISIPIINEEKATISAAPDVMFKNLLKYGNGQQMMKDIYRSFIEDAYSRSMYRNFIDELLKNESPEASLLFHCTVGKDRTGFAAALLLGILGVGKQEIISDYVATNLYLKESISETINQAKQQGAPDSLLTEIQLILSAQPEFLQASYQSMDTLYGGFEGYLKDGLTITKDEITAIRHLYSDYQ